MNSRLAATVFILGFACVVPPMASAQPDLVLVKELDVDLPLGKDHWDTRLLERDPVKMVSITATKRFLKLPDLEPKPENPEKPEKLEKPIEQIVVHVVLEFERDLTIRDTDWTGVQPKPPFRFDFLDKDGVTLSTQLGTYDGVFVGRRGRRVRIVLTMPPETVMARIKKVLVDSKSLGDLP